MGLTLAQVAGVVADPPTGSTKAEWVAKARQEAKKLPDGTLDPAGEDWLGSGHIGLWQIADSHWDDTPAIKGRSGSKANYRNQLKGANFNWGEARRLYLDDMARGGNGWRPWAASGGKPTPNADDRQAAGTPDSSIGASGGSAGDLGVANEGLGPLNPIDDVAGAIGRGVEIVGDAAEWITDTHNIVRVLYVAGGMALGLVAFAIFIKPVVADTTSTVKNAVKV